MASPIVGLMSSIATLWEAATPPSDTGITYKENLQRRKMTGNSGHRTFYWTLPQRLEVTAQYGGGNSNVLYGLEAIIRLSTRGKDIHEIADMVANEGNLLARQVEITSSWPAGVLECFTDDISSEYEGDEDGDVLLTIGITAHVQETDT